jgi:hypothetical protein
MPQREDSPQDRSSRRESRMAEWEKQDVALTLVVEDLA